MARHKKRPVSLAGPKVHLATVQNPDWRADLDGEKAFPRDIQAAVNLKESAIETLFARKFLSKSQKQAADRFRELWESAGGKSSSLDYTQDRVDGGRGDPVTSKLAALQELSRARAYLGMRGYETVEAICGQGKALTDLAPHKRERLTMADNLRADLDDLGGMWGYQTKQRHRA
jgi:hypothetical protein